VSRKHPKAIPIAFNDLEIWAIHELALKRQQLKERYRVKSKKVSETLSDLDLHVIGRKSEYAVARLLALQIDLDDTQEGDGGVDLIYRGLSIDVKCSSSNLLGFKVTQPFKADVAIFCQPVTKYSENGKFKADAIPDKFITGAAHAWRNINIVGWISRERFEQISRPNTSGEKCVNWYNLNDMKSLREYATRAKKSKTEDLIEKGKERMQI
jgi:hypothetical protein